MNIPLISMIETCNYCFSNNSQCNVLIHFVFEWFANINGNYINYINKRI